MWIQAETSTSLCSTMVNETIQYCTENGGKRVYVILLDGTKAFEKCHSKFYLIYYWIKMYAPQLFSYYITCVITNNVMLIGELQNQQVFQFQIR